LCGCWTRFEQDLKISISEARAQNLSVENVIFDGDDCESSGG